MIHRSSAHAAVPRVPLSRLRSLLAVAILAILSHLGAEWPGTSQALLQVADWHARTGAEYRRNAGTNWPMAWVAAWHSHMRRVYERAADRPWTIPPASRPLPPQGWAPPANP